MTLPMRWTIPHAWDLSVEEARAVQAQLAGRVIVQPAFAPSAMRTVAGVDVGFRADQARAAAVVLSFPDLEPVDWSLAEAPVTFPYVPGLLAFREAPAVLKALEGLSTWPDLFIFDAQGIAHPRRLGLAAHLGVLLDCPSIGCAKSRLVGRHSEPPEAAASWTPLYDGEEVIGAVVRTRTGQRPMYVSVGHRIDLQTAIDLVLACTRGHRLPETTRCAHKLAGGGKLPCRL